MPEKGTESRAFLARKRKKEGSPCLEKDRIVGFPCLEKDCVSSFSPAAPAEAMPKFFLHKLHTSSYSGLHIIINHDTETQCG